MTSPPAVLLRHSRLLSHSVRHVVHQSRSNSSNSSSNKNVQPDERNPLTSASTAATIPPNSASSDNTPISASSFLFNQALIEDAEETSKPRPRHAIDPDAWTGDEPQRSAIIRIMQDSYKPLRIKVGISIIIFLIFVFNRCNVM
jgi:uncharacterized protein involved in copper resistance